MKLKGAALVLLALTAVACSAEPMARRGTSAGFSAAGDVRLHPDAIEVARIDPALAYEVTVAPESLAFALAGHEGIFAQIVPGRSILVGPPNEGAPEKNHDGFVRFVTAKDVSDGVVTLSTERRSVFSVIRGALSQKDMRVSGEGGRGVAPAKARALDLQLGGQRFPHRRRRQPL